MFDTIKENYGKLDYLVNNAGTFIDNFIKDFDISDFKKKLIQMNENKTNINCEKLININMCSNH